MLCVNSEGSIYILNHCHARLHIEAFKPAQVQSFHHDNHSTVNPTMSGRHTTVSWGQSNQTKQCWLLHLDRPSLSLKTFKREGIGLLMFAQSTNGNHYMCITQSKRSETLTSPSHVQIDREPKKGCLAAARPVLEWPQPSSLSNSKDFFNLHHEADTGRLLIWHRASQDSMPRNWLSGTNADHFGPFL